MGTYAGKIKFSVSATPIETLTDGESTTHLVPQSTAAGTIGGDGEITMAAMQDAGGANYGYENGVKYYASAAIGSLGDLTATAIDFAVVKHTGFQGAAGTTKGTTASTDTLQVAVHNGSTAVTCGLLTAGEAMVIPLRGLSATAHKIQIRSVATGSLPGSLANGSAIIQVEYWAST